jgi:uncharacterized protein HemY
MDAEMANQLAQIIAEKAKTQNTAKDDRKLAQRNSLKRLRVALNSEDYDAAGEVLDDLWDLKYEQTLSRG